MAKSATPIADLIKAAAMQELPKGDDNNSVARRMHLIACRQLQAYHSNYDVPYGVLVYMGIGTSAHKPSFFEKGYKKFNIDFCNRVIELAEIFAKKFGAKWRTNDLMIHAICGYLKDVKTNKEFGVFKSAFSKAVKAMPKDTNLSHSKIDQAAKLFKLIFQDSVEYTPAGRFKALKTISEAITTTIEAVTALVPLSHYTNEINPLPQFDEKGVLIVTPKIINSMLIDFKEHGLSFRALGRKYKMSDKRAAKIIKENDPALKEQLVAANVG